MHIVVLSLFVALVACVAALIVFWLFTVSPAGRRSDETGHRRLPRIG